MHLRPPASIVPVRLAAVAAVAVSFAATIRRVLAFFFILRWAATVTVDAVVALVDVVNIADVAIQFTTVLRLYA